MKKSTINIMMAFLLLGGIIFTTASCKKARLNRETTTDEDNSLAESSFDDVDKSASEVAVKEEGVKSKTAPAPEYSFGASCATVTHKDANGVILYVNSVKYDTTKTDSAIKLAPFPRTIIIDFGTGCTGNDGRTRKGKIIISLSAKFWEVGTVITHTLDNYYVNDHHVEGVRKVTHSATNVWDVVVTGAKITDPDGKTVSWESTRTRTRTSGDATPFNIFDDVYSITGSATGINREGRNFTVTITTALQLQACNWIAEITKGIIEIQPEGLKLRTVDFGDGTCDNEGTVTVGNKTKTFKLRK